ncbi:ATP-binding protein [Candidatus Poribacteria bacterium]|nr:ATP-binding protein [Candidatus Poribacteria bacterium]MYK22255.1 ATP-binding protein [Candidatus Poribacteria bacterium]
MAKADIKLKIPSTVFYIEPIRAFIGNLAQNLGFSRKRVADIQLVLDEICSNAIHHGSVDATVGVKLRIRIDTHSLEVLVRDTGAPHTTEKSWLTHERLSEIEEHRSPSSESGHGIFIAKSLADTHEMQPNSAGGTDVRVVFGLLKPNDLKF